MKGMGLENEPVWLERPLKKLFEHVIKGSQDIEKLIKNGYDNDIDYYLSCQGLESGKIVKELISKKQKVYGGSFSADLDSQPLGLFFCLESIFVNNDDIFFDASAYTF
jgi:hypothetical protein